MLGIPIGIALDNVMVGICCGVLFAVVGGAGNYVLGIGQKRRNEMPLHNHLKEMRARLDVNQQEMGKLVGTSRQTISQLERGDYSPSVTLALKIAKVCGVSVEEIFEYEEDAE